MSPCSPTSGVPSGAGASANRTGDKTKFEDVVHTNTMGGAIKRICEQLEGLTQLQQSVKEVQQSLSLLQGSVLFQDKTLEQVRLLLVDRGTKSWDMSQDFSSEAPAVQHVECPKPIQKRRPQMYGTSISGCHIFLILLNSFFFSQLDLIESFLTTYMPNGCSCCSYHGTNVEVLSCFEGRFKLANEGLKPTSSSSSSSSSPNLVG